MCKKSSCNAEVLTPPNKATLDESFVNVGKTLHAVMEPIEEDDGLVS